MSRNPLPVGNVRDVAAKVPHVDFRFCARDQNEAPMRFAKPRIVSTDVRRNSGRALLMKVATSWLADSVLGVTGLVKWSYLLRLLCFAVIGLALKAPMCPDCWHNYGGRTDVVCLFVGQHT